MNRMITGLLLLIATMAFAAPQDATHHLEAYVVNARDGAPIPGA